MYKNIEKQTKLQLKDLVEYQPGQVISKTLVQNEKVRMTIFSFDIPHAVFGQERFKMLLIVSF